MAKIIGVRFRSRGKTVYCDAGDIAPQVNDYVVVDTDRGPDVAKVVTLEAAPQPGEQLARIVRQAEARDLEEASLNLKGEALSECKEMAAELGLQMKPLLAHCDPENERVTVFFSAQERVDFRDLVRKLSHALQMRVELRQAGARHEAKLLGSMGRCGYPLCCQSFLTNFASVSIKMAKDQSLALNPMKISGICGRLLCCLAYESKDYAAMKKKMPRPRQEVLTPRGKATVISTNFLKETVTVKLENETISELPLDQLVQER
jgi:cell fate regulator YaaT (PSP1 superfamily)